MKKRFIALLLILVMLLGACSSKQKTNETSSGTSVTKELAGLSFDVPSGWEESNSTENILYFYPDNAMLMVNYSDFTGNDITNEFTRTQFIEGMRTSFENYSLQKEKEMTIGTLPAYEEQATLTIDGESYYSDIVYFSHGNNIVFFMLAQLESSNVDYTKDFSKIIQSIKTDDTLSSTTPEDPEVEVNGYKTEDDTLCVTVKNNSSVVIPLVDIQVNFKDANGQTIKTETDGHDAVLPNHTVVSRISCPDEYSDFVIEKSIDMNANSYVNHSEDVSVSSNEGDGCIIAEVTNNSDTPIDEIELVAVLYKNDAPVFISYPEDEMDVAPGETKTIELSTYYDLNGIEYDRFEVFLNQAHTF